MQITAQTLDNLSRLTDEAAVLTDAEGTIVVANEKATDLLGHQIVGNPLEAFIRLPDLPAAIRRANAENLPSRFAYSRMDVVKRQFNISVAPIDGQHVYVLLQDTTLEPTLERLQSDFVANVSHELRSPLNALNGFIETLLGPAADDPEAQQQFLPIMQSEAARMQRLIDGLLSLSRFEAEAYRPPVDHIKLLDLIQSVVAVKQAQAEAEDMRIVVQNASAATALILADADEMAEVFHNLLENAIRYGDNGTDIIIDMTENIGLRGTHRQGVLRVRVINQGKTIDARHLSRLTERFYRIDEGRARSMGGSGLGLAIVKHILNRHRGRIGITSDNGETCVALIIPTLSTPS
jgi:two-component system phosphate regulon sensor histidine kinase PhoR